MWNVLTCEIHDVFSAPWFQHSYEYGLLHLTTVIMEISISSWKKTRQEFCSESNILSLCCVWLCKQLVTTTWSLLFGFFHGGSELWHSNCWGGQQPGTLSASEIWIWGKIQGDGRKFLDRFKSYFGSQISSQSLNEIHTCRLQPQSATKGEFFSYCLDCQFQSAHVALWRLT